ncbi:hypothetical protein Droror1_Dr00002057 [Drosera rotundifolia]
MKANGDDVGDLAHLQSIMRSIEFACNSIQMHVNPAAAEAAIATLKNSPRPYQACRFILEHSQVPSARFQAAAIIRDAAMREWALLSLDDKRGLISFCLCYVMQNATYPAGYVLAKVSSVAAQLMKRGWLEFAAADKEGFLLEVKQAVIGSHDVYVQYFGIHFLESLVSEFLPSTSTALGLPRELHEFCRLSMEQDYLKMFYCWVQEAALGLTNRVIESNSEAPEVKVCTAALRLMLQILSWDFRHTSDDVGKTSIDVFYMEARDDALPSGKPNFALVQPGSSWQDILISSGHVMWLLSLYGSWRLKSSEGYWLDCPMAVAARKLILQLCSLSGTIFASDNSKMQEHHLIQLLCGIFPWINPPAVVSQELENGKSDSEMLDACRALLAMANVTSPVVFDGLLRSICPSGTIDLLSALMAEALKSLIMSDSDEEKWSWVARDILLDTWTTLLAPADSGSQKLLSAEGISAAAGVFRLIVKSELKSAAASAFDDDDVGSYLQASVIGMDERLSSYGTIARAAIEHSVPLLTKLFSERFALLAQNKRRSDPTAILEELYSLFLICGHVLADDGVGESPLVPDSIQTHFVDFSDGNNHPVVVLSGSILSFAEKSTDPEIRASIFSPRLMEAVVWFLARWSGTYLMPPDSSGDNFSSLVRNKSPSRKVLLQYFGEDGQGKHHLDVIVRISTTALLSYPGEKTLQDLTCSQLLHGLVRHKNVCAHLLVLDSWGSLANSFANERIFLSLNSSQQRSLAQTLVLSASGMNNLEASNHYVRNLMNHAVAYLVDLSAKNNLKNVAEMPETILTVSCLLERLRGAASASGPQTQKALYDVGFSVMDPVLTLLDVYKHESAVVYLLLKFVVQWVEAQIIYLGSRETAGVANFCMRLLQLYSSHNLGKISLHRSSALVNEEKTEKYKDLRALLQLLAVLCSKDLGTFSSDPTESQGINISQVVYAGLHIITPLISVDLLKYPKLCSEYFSLLSHMLEVNPKMIAQLNGDAVACILTTLDFGLQHHDPDVVDKCLQSLKALASFHYKDTSGGGNGLGSHASGFMDSSGMLHEGIFKHFFPSLLQFLLFKDYSPDLVSAAADALLPVILCEQGLYQSLGNLLIERQMNPEYKSRLANALQSLTSSNQLSSSLDRINYQRFRKNLLSFLVEVRGFLRID